MFFSCAKLLLHWLRRALLSFDPAEIFDSVSSNISNSAIRAVQNQYIPREMGEILFY